jgi:hypothetical protein
VFIISDIRKEKDEILKWLKQMIFSSLITASFSCTIFTIIYCIFIISESYMIYYSMIVIIILVSIYYYIHLILRYKHDVSYNDCKKFNISKIVKPLLVLAYIYCILNLVFLCQFNFIYKGKKFIYTFDPIFQEMLDNMSDRNTIMKYIFVNAELASRFMQDVIVKEKTNKYNLLIEQINTISNKEVDLENMYKKLVFNQNKIIYEYIIEYVSISKLIRIELNRLQFVGPLDLIILQGEIENDIRKIQDNIDEFLNMEQAIESQKTDQIVFGDLHQRMKILQEENESILNNQPGYEYVLDQAAINHLVISEINSLVEKSNNIAQKISEEYEKELKLFKSKKMIW